MRNVVVTGGTSGIGEAIARRFVEEGDAVIITGRSPDRVAGTAEKLGATGAVCDVTAVAGVERFAQSLPRPIDVIVAMAGGNTDFRPADDEPDLSPLARVDRAWTNNLRLNTIGTVLIVSALMPLMTRGGSIITVGSIGAEYASTSYGAAKAAVTAWTAGLSSWVGAQGITANAIAPGYITDTDFFGDTLTPERRRSLIDATHNKRAGTPADVAGVAIFLAGADARHVTGQTLHVNGGAHTTR